MTAETMSLFGDQLLAVALPLYAFDRTGTASISAALVLARVVPLALLGALGGAIADRTRRRRLLVGIGAARAVAVLPLFLVARHLLPLGFAFAVVALLAGMAQLAGPAIGASLPAVVTPDDLPRANSRLAARTVVGMSVGTRVAATTDDRAVAGPGTGWLWRRGDPACPGARPVRGRRR